MNGFTITKTKTSIESDLHYAVTPMGKYEPVVLIDSENQIVIELIPSDGEPTITFNLGRVISNRLISMIQRLGLHSQGASR